jgi:DNA invertase Pin-like site-specific DNA recombinase
MNIGYARVSTEEQNLDLQIQALEAAGCDVVFRDHGASGATRDRPGLAQALSRLREGDVLVVWKLDRLGRSLPHLVEVVDSLRQRGIGFRSLQEQIDTTSAGGRFYFHMLAALAEFERAMISERTKAGMAAAKRNGKHVGRPRKLSDLQIRRARESIASGRETRTEVAARLGVDMATLRRALGTGGEPAHRAPRCDAISESSAPST